MAGVLKSVMNQFHVYNHYLKQRQRYLANQKIPNELRNLLSEQPPRMEVLATEVEYLVLDFETTGLDANTDTILSLGWVEIANFTVNVASAKQLFIESPNEVKAETAVINHIMPEMLQDGISLDSAMTQLFQAAKTKY